MKHFPLKLKQNNQMHQTMNSNIFLDKISLERKSLGREFFLNSKKIEKPNFELNQNNLDVFIEKYLRANNKIEANHGNSGKENELEKIENLSLPISPRHSFKKMKELYSTHRRTKI